MSRRHAAPTQRGAALLTAMIIVALIATLAASMLWQQWRAVQVEAAERERTQSAWILAGALDWARLILREDGKASRGTPPIDHLGEPWAVPLQEARLTSFLASDKGPVEDAPDAFLSGEISDATARFNLTNLAKSGQIVPEELLALSNLCQSVGVNVEVARRIAEGMRDAAPPQPAAPGASAVVQAANPPIQPVWAHDLGWLGIDAESVRALDPYVVILPGPTLPNLNTASPEVIAAAVAGMDAGTAERLVQARQRAPLKKLPDDLVPIAGANAASAAQRSTVSSSYFEVRGRLRLGQVVLEQRSIVFRDTTNAVTVVQRERIPGRDTRDR